MARDEQDRLLASTVRDLDTQKQSVAALADAWKAGDTHTVERIVLDDLKREPRLYERLLVERNRNWMPRIEALLCAARDRTCRCGRRASDWSGRPPRDAQEPGLRRPGSAVTSLMDSRLAAGSPCSWLAPDSPALPRLATSPRWARR